MVATNEMVHASCRQRRQHVNTLAIRGHCCQQHVGCARLTAAIEMVARAKGSPMMLPKLMRLRPYWALEYSILVSDGERSEP